MHCWFFFEVTNLEFIDKFLVREVFCSRVEEIVGEDVCEDLIISFIFEDFFLISASVDDVIEMLRFEVTVVVDAGHWFEYITKYSRLRTSNILRIF